jgi:hypothetical protein
MLFSATVLNVLIASPSDVPLERDAIALGIYDWNALHSKESGKVLLPVRWETLSAPAMGERPQGIINAQVVRNCDVLIGCFWTRLGSPTGEEDSGTVEEIRYFLKNNKPVMLYFSSQQIDPNTINLKQFEKLKAFRDSIRDKGIQETYASVSELKEKLSRHLTIVMRGMSVGAVVPSKVVREANAATQSAQSAPPIQPTTESSGGNGTIRMVNYTEKALVVRGNTRDFKEPLKAAGGKWIKTKNGEHAWMFSKRRVQDVAAILRIAPEIKDE